SYKSAGRSVVFAAARPIIPLEKHEGVGNSMRIRGTVTAVAVALLPLSIGCGNNAGTTPAAATAPGVTPAKAAVPDATPASPLPPLEAQHLSPPGTAAPGAAELTIAENRAVKGKGPDGIDARAGQADRLYDGGRSAEAEKIYREVLSGHPDHVASLAGLAQILLDRDDLNGAAPLVDRALKANPDSVPAVQRKIALLLARDQSDQAVTLAQTALRREANSAALQAALGDAQRAYGDLPKAIDAYRKAVALNPGWAPGWT